jgi:hypothetical protein
MTGFITSRCHRPEQRLTRAQKTEEGRLDSIPFFVGGHKPSDSLSGDADSVLGRWSRYKTTHTMRECVHTTYGRVCVCTFEQKRAVGARSENTETPDSVGLDSNRHVINDRDRRRPVTTTTTYYTQTVGSSSSVCVQSVYSVVSRRTRR